MLFKKKSPGHVSLTYLGQALLKRSSGRLKYGHLIICFTLTPYTSWCTEVSYSHRVLKWMSEQLSANIYMVSWVITNQRDKWAHYVARSVSYATRRQRRHPIRALISTVSLWASKTTKNIQHSQMTLCWNHPFVLLLIHPLFRRGAAIITFQTL